MTLSARVRRESSQPCFDAASVAYKLTDWVEHEKAGSHKLSLTLPLSARHKGHDTLRITETGNSKPKILTVTLAV